MNTVREMDPIVREMDPIGTGTIVRVAGSSRGSQASSAVPGQDANCAFSSGKGPLHQLPEEAWGTFSPSDPPGVGAGVEGG